MNGRAPKIQRLHENSHGSATFPTSCRPAVGGNAEESQSRQHDEGFNDALLALPEFLVSRRVGKQPSRVPACALLSGPPQSGKTSLLLQLAHNLAVDARARVVFICKPENFENDYIYLSPDLGATCEVSERINIKYIKNDEELCQYFAAFHLYQELPTAVIVDDFVDYFGDCFDLRQKRFQSQATGEVSLVKILSIFHNAIGYAKYDNAHPKPSDIGWKVLFRTKAVPGMQCRLIISDTHRGDGPRLLYIFKRWMSEVYVIKGLGDTSKFSLELQHIKTGEMGNVVGRFTIAHQVLHFDGLEARSEVAL